MTGTDPLHQFMIRTTKAPKGRYPWVASVSMLEAIEIHRLGLEDETIEVIRERLHPPKETTV